MTCSKQVSMEERVERPRGDVNLVDASLGQTLGIWEQIDVYTSFCPEDKFGFAVFNRNMWWRTYCWDCGKRHERFIVRVRTKGSKSMLITSGEKMFTPVKFDWGEPVSPCQLSRMSLMFMLHYRRSNWEVLRENYFKSRSRQREWNTIEWHGEKGKMITPVKLGSLWTLANNRRWAWGV